MHGPELGLSPAHRRERPLSRDERILYVLLGVPGLGLSLGVTTLAAYVPVLARNRTDSRTLIGALVGCEGLVALLLPIWVGALSDRLHSRLGKRIPFLLATAPVAAFALVMLPLARSFALLALFVSIFYVGYFTYYAPYRALYSDLVPVEQSGRAQGILGTFRGAGMGSALVGGALLLPIWPGLPFAVSAFVLLATTGVFLLRRLRREQGERSSDRSMPREVWSLVRRHPDIRRFLGANALWALTEAGLKTFIVLYLTRGLHKSFAFSAVAMVIVAVAALVAAPLAGKFADRYGRVRVMRLTIAVFGIGLFIPAFSRSTPLLLAILPIVGVGGAMALSLPYAILTGMLPSDRHGVGSGLFDVSGGVGALLGPLVTGAAIDLLRPVFRSTDGYAAMWAVIGSSALLSFLFLPKVSPTEARPV